MTTKLALFENKKVRSHWDNEKEEWYFSVVDICGVLSEQPTQRGATLYWGKLKERLKEEGSELLTNCQQLKMLASDGKKYLTDAMDTKDILRLIQSIPSPKAEPFKIWLSQLGQDRLDEIYDPEKAIDRAIMTYKQKGYSDKWITGRLKSKEIHASLVSEWKEHGITESRDFALLTDEILKTWSGKTSKEYKDFKALKKENLRDNMSQMELLLTMLGEQATKDLTQQHNPLGFNQNKSVAQQGGGVAFAARKQYEQQLGKSAITPLNFNQAKQLNKPKDEGEA